MLETSALDKMFTSFINCGIFVISMTAKVVSLSAPNFSDAEKSFDCLK